MKQPSEPPVEELLARDAESFAPAPAEFDLLTDLLLPSALFVMLGSLVWFLLDVRAAAAQEPTRLLRWIFFCFMLAVVGIARIRARGGAFDAAPYAIALLLAMGLFGYLFAFGGGAFGGGYGGGNPPAALLYNYLVIAFIWFGGNYIVDQTTIDPEAAEVDAALLSSEDWEQQGAAASAVRRRPHPGRAVMVLSLVALGVFGVGHQQLAGHPYQSHAFACMVVFLGSGLAVLAMSALAGLALYVRQRGTRLPPGMVALWLGLALPLAALILSLAQAAPKLEPRANTFHPKAPAWLENWLQPGPAVFEAPYGEAAAPSADNQAGLAGEKGPGGGRGQSHAENRGRGEQGEGRGSGGQRPGRLSEEPSRQRAEGRRGQPAGEGAEARGGREASPSPGPGAAEEGRAGQQRAAEGGPPRGADQERLGEAERRSEPSDTSPDQESPPESPEPAEPPEPEAPAGEQDEPAADEGQPPPAPAEEEPSAPDVDWQPLLRALLTILAGLLIGTALILLSRRLPPRRGRHPADEPVVTRDPFVDPFGPRSPFRGRPPAELVVHVYRAFQAYATMVGKPRHPEMTAHDYLRELPPSMASWRDRIEQLTELYAAVEYTPGSVGEDDLEDLRAIWERLMQAVREARGG